MFSDVIQMLEADGKVVVKDGSSDLLKLPLRCHVCCKELPTIPALKEHIKSHFPSWISVWRMKAECCVDLLWVGHFACSFVSSFEKNKTCHMSVLLSVLAGFQLFWIVFFDCSICEDSAFWMMHTKAQACLMFVIKYFQRTELWCFFNLNCDFFYLIVKHLKILHSSI